MPRKTFRDHYVDYNELTTQLRTWERAHSGITRLKSLGKSGEGREIWCLVIGREPDVPKPAVWVDGNMHATELCGTNVALAIAEDVLSIHQDKDVAGLPAHVREFLKDVLFYVVPRISPDGAEQAVRSGRYVRSSPEDTRLHKGHSRWESADVDGDGRVRLMRREDPNGEMVESPHAPGVLVPRTLDHAGPYYKVYPEGVIANWDGRAIPSPYFLGDNQYDFNRNFPWSWAPEPEQAGAGDYPGSAPETRAVIQAATASPHLFAWLNIHTFGGVFIRPLGHKPDSKMDQGDLAIYRQVEAWAKEHTTYPTVSGYHEFLYEPDKPLRGDLTDFAYHQRGCIAYVVELWDIFRRIGMAVKKPFVDHYSHVSDNDALALVTWDREHNKGRLFQPWTPFEHPQIGKVEIGGVHALVGISNPPYELIDEVCKQQSAAFLRVAALVPRVTLTVEKTESLGQGVTKIDVTIGNAGYLGTYGIPSARKLPISEPLRLKVEGDGVTLASAPAGLLEIGHLEGWGQGLYSGHGLFLPWTRGSVSEHKATLVVKGKGTLRLAVESCRVGRTEKTLEVGG